uniref:Putative secreted peptide n=1 Tax=Anopheles braziliensis TaxID=58242 RepID=A0A2M3ZUB8_9DIPT
MRFTFPRFALSVLFSFVALPPGSLHISAIYHLVPSLAITLPSSPVHRCVAMDSGLVRGFIFFLLYCSFLFAASRDPLCVYLH